ncbi:MAG: zinc metalloprotease HtpX [Candidatus Jacksonbacteria bacterium RIFOXYA2_FULL_44_7]|uniref:Protease HtpX homolog n=1 Tax=Candidatus Jacksonbacteria bacterium RIFCSPLOWO2_02_FULL_44_20 TaxID=1798460 RepID=A0A1G2A8J8_9BACT|nr:MAG: Protease HtpX-like protein [Parcubacteria group bacterium GW2011_GWC2_44_17]KKT48325.1 MAG: Protease HtpX-like protein [Parcubacteria group bacterium GW2011_GWF2_44_17]OGY70791.1 MAG: zinc metalloprotease HtpX [Candidatus Jacksonbacteria bacterium RIFCSPHIGHO2_12_FULL_44_12]OGY71658.1 MAG: zinc metalloprotease HtpX [Candidatus Jacksonbacteria bacterium RIFCSPHIGHO2_02_FULL_44_25]OGY72979.1 MAG: zinc metalloprotease HtpX [Candidatus Jacksonbacteria bacterium RIFCSPLOWO2_02_FULL_44_20]OG
MYKPIVVNKRKTWSLITVFLIFIIGLGWLFSRVYPEYSFILPVAVIFSVISSWISYFYSDKIVLAISRAKEIKKQDNPYLYRMVENLCITSGLPAPRVYIIDDTAMNAFATGRDPKHATVAFTKGIIDRLENEELEGVVAHELSHIKNYDTRLQTIVVTLVGVVVLMSDFFLRMTWFGHRRRDSDRGGGQLQAIFMILALILAILAPLAAILIQLAISRKREFLADAEGALLTRYPDGLARALEKISHDAEPLEVANKATAHLYFANPLKGGVVSKLFSTHPPIEERVRALRGMTR